MHSKCITSALHLRTPLDGVDLKRCSTGAHTIRATIQILLHASTLYTAASISACLINTLHPMFHPQDHIISTRLPSRFHTASHPSDFHRPAFSSSHPFLCHAAFGHRPTIIPCRRATVPPVCHIDLEPPTTPTSLAIQASCCGRTL